MGACGEVAGGVPPPPWDFDVTCFFSVS